MKIELTMPALRPEMQSGVLCRWIAAEGQIVMAGEPLYEIETDKVVTEVEAERDLKILSLLAEEGDDVPVGRPVALAESGD